MMSSQQYKMESTKTTDESMDDRIFPFEFFTQKLGNLVFNVQVLLGRKERIRTQYQDSNLRSTFAKKHIRIVSVVLFLVSVSMFAVGAGIYYGFYWRPCTKKFFFQPSDNLTCAFKDYNWGEFMQCSTERREADEKCVK